MKNYTQFINEKNSEISWPHRAITLINAIQTKKSLSEIKEIIKNGANLNETDNYLLGWTPLTHALRTNRYDIFQELIKSGANVDLGIIIKAYPPTNEPILILSLRYDYVVDNFNFDLRYANSLIDNHANTNLTDSYGTTPLMEAAQTIFRIDNKQGIDTDKNTDILKKLIKNGAKWSTESNEKIFIDFLNENSKKTMTEYIKNNFTEEYENYLVKKNAKKYNIL